MSDLLVAAPKVAPPLASERSSRRGTLVPAAVLVVSVLALSIMTVLRYTTEFLQADGVQQSTMSIQSVDLFFWGQNRFAAFVSLLARPGADPTARTAGP